MTEIAQAINGGQFYQGLFTGLLLGVIVGGLGTVLIMEWAGKKNLFQNRRRESGYLWKGYNMKKM